MVVETASDIVMSVQRREATGKEAAAKLRQQGKVPAVVYGGGKEPVTIIVDAKAIRDILKRETGENTIFLLKLEGTKHERRAMIKELQVDPLTHEFIHIDFIRVVKGHKLHVTLPVELEGDSVGVRHGGLLDFVSRELAIEVLPREIPEKIVVDISNLEVGDHVTVDDLTSQLPASGRFLDDGHRVVVTVGHMRVFKEEAEEAAEAELVIGEQAEPEVIGRGQEEETEE